MLHPRLWQHRRTLLLAALILLLAACATLEQQQWFQQTRDFTLKTTGTVTDATGKAMQRMEGYLAKKELLETFRDSAEHSEDAVLNVLRNAGIGRRAAGASTTQDGKGSSVPTKPATPAAPSAPKTVPAPSALPASYAGNYRWPLDAGIISSEYGPRGGKTHKGIDIAADTGEPVYAVAAGEVIYAGNGLSGYGNVVILRHDQQVTSLYAHNSALKVKQGAPVKQGELIALLGNTGRSTGPHVHFEVRRGDASLNPRTLLPKSMVAEVSAGQPLGSEYVAMNGG